MTLGAGLRSGAVLVSLGVSLIGRASPAHAQGVGTSTVAPLTVTARAPALRDPTATRSRLDDAALDRARVEGASLADLVDRLPGARVLDDGGPLHAQRLTVRGGSAAQAQLVIDGLPLSTPFATGLDVGLLGPEAIARATLVRGGAGALLGDGALTGALLVETRTPAEQPALAATVRGGTIDRFGLGASGATGVLAMSADVERTSGRFGYVSRLVGLPDVARVRENNDASAARASARSAVELAGGRLDVLAGGAVREGGLPGFETQADLEARERRAHGLARVSWRRAFGDETTLELAAQGNLLDLGFTDEDEASRTTFAAGSGEATLGWSLGAHRLRVGAGGGAEASRSTEHDAPVRGRGHLALADTVRLGDLTALGALRLAVVGSSGAVLLPRLGLTWTATRGVSLGIGGGRSFRAPAIDELYHPVTRGFAGNPDLLPETAWEGELTLRLARAAPLLIGAAGFVRRVEGTIVYVNQNAFLVRPENLGGATVVGGELELSAAVALGPIVLSASAAGSVTHSALDASGARLPTAPPLAGDAELRASWSSAPIRELSLYTRGAVTAATTANLAGTVPVDAYARWDAGLSVVLDVGCSLGVEVTNLLDDRALESVFKLPLPGRALLATLRVEAG